MRELFDAPNSIAGPTRRWTLTRHESGGYQGERRCAGADGHRPRRTADIIAAAGPQLKLIANFGVGFNHIDVKAAGARGIAVTNTPGVLTDATADIAMTLMLMVTRRAIEGVKILESGGFPGWCPTWLMGVSLGGKQARHHRHGPHRRSDGARGSMGFFGMEIHYYNRSAPAPAVEGEKLGADLLGNARCHAAADGYRVDQLSVYATNLSSVFGRKAGADETLRLSH